MKKVSSKEKFEFLIEGIKGTATEKSVVINSNGVEVDDAAANLIASRYGSLVEITDVKKPATKAKADGDTDVKEGEKEKDDAPEKDAAKKAK